MIKKCAECGVVEIETKGNGKFCEDCKLKLKETNAIKAKEYGKKYYKANKKMLNILNGQYKKVFEVKPTTEQKTTWKKTNELIKSGLLNVQDKCVKCGVEKSSDVKLCNHHSSYVGDYAAYNIMRVCNSCHRKIHSEIKKQKEKIALKEKLIDQIIDILQKANKSENDINNFLDFMMDEGINFENVSAANNESEISISNLVYYYSAYRDFLKKSND